MKLDAKTIGIILTFLTSLGGGCTWLYGTAEKTGKLEAQVEFNKEHEKMVDELIGLRISCNRTK